MRNLKKIIALVAVFAMLVSSVAFAGTFGDVAETDNYAKAIELLYDLEIVTGDDNDGDGVMDFRPEDTITRAEVTALIARIQGLDVVAQAATEFNDVPSSHWASGYVAQAATQGIVNGYGDGNFGPEDNVTYEQIVKMLMCTLGYEPFAADAGGFPTGYVAAATRYGVLDGVVGGSIGVEASRGMVAQMIYNAINTPLMDAVTYGADKEFGIYDGINYKLQTLLTRDLKMIKFTGIVTANSVSDSIDVTARKTASIYPYQTNDNSYYLGGWKYDDGNKKNYLETQVVYQGDVDIDPYLGYPVEVYAKKMSNFENNFTVVALAPQPANSEVTFALDQYEGYTDNVDHGIVEYLKDANSNVKISKAIAENVTVIYNGVPAVYAAVQTEGQDTPGDESDDKYRAQTDLEALGAHLALINATRSGKVTLLDTDSNPAYDVVKIEIAATGVVKEVTNKGKVKWMSAPVAAKGGKIDLEFDENDVDTIINLTKNGEAIDYTELKKWDVVTILWNGTKGYYDVRVLDEGNYVDGVINVHKGDAVVLSDGNTYKFASNSYPYAIGQVEPGMSGRFYVDEYGKVVAMDDSVEIDGVTSVVDNYAYVLKADAVKSTWGEYVVNVKILDKSGATYDAELASKVKLVNFDQDSDFAQLVDVDKDGDKDAQDTYGKTEIIGAEYIDAANFAKNLVNKVIGYEANDNRQVKTIVLATKPSTAVNENREMASISKSDNSKYNAAYANAEYIADAMSFKGTPISVNENTAVFFIAPGTNSITYGDDTYTSKAEDCSVATVASLIDGQQYDVLALAPDVNDEAQVVVLMNEAGKDNPALNVAVIDSVGDAVVNGDTIKTVTYWMNGELQTANTKDDTISAVNTAKQGDVVRLMVENGVITYATSVFNFTDVTARNNGFAYVEDENKTPLFFKATPGINSEEEYIFGAVTSFANSGAAWVQPLKSFDDSNAIELNGDAVSVKEGDANVYVYDVNMKNKDYRLSAGSLGDAETDDDLMKDGSKTVTIKNYNGGSTTTPAYGMMDYVFVRYYNNKVADIVVYRNYEYDYTVAE